MKLFEIVPLPVLVAALVAVVNVLTEVTKRLLPVKKAPRVVTVWACLLACGCAIAACIMQGWTGFGAVTLAGAVGLLAGGLIAYAAMFGYDELYQDVVKVLQQLLDYRGPGKGETEHDSGRKMP